MRFKLTILCLLACIMSASAQTADTPDTLQVSMLTCSPGPEIFELYGHEAVRVRGKYLGQNIDVVFNYGVFDYYSPGFIYRFVKGETDYMCTVEPTDLFLYPYKRSGRAVKEQTLALNTTEAISYFTALLRDTEEGNRTYRYKYFSNNCATRPMERLKSTLGDRLKFRATGDSKMRSLRDALIDMDGNYPWYQFGIDLVLNVERLSQPAYDFAPVDLQQALTESTLERMYSPANNSVVPLVSKEEMIIAGEGDRRLAPTPFLLSPLFICWTFLILVISIVTWGQLKRRNVRWLSGLWFTVLGLGGCLVSYLTFFSVHEGTSGNTLIWWLNPLWLIAAIWVWLKIMPKPRAVFIGLLAACPAVLMILKLAGIIAQYYNPAIYPLMVATLVVAIPVIKPRHRIHH